MQRRKQSTCYKEGTAFTYPLDQSSKDIITVTRHDLGTIYNSSMLNDVIISLFLKYELDIAQIPSDVKEKIYVFNSFFFSKLQSLKGTKTDEPFKCASRWIKDVNIFDKDFLVMPVCEKDHWVLVIICYPGRELTKKPRDLDKEKLCEPAVIVLNSFANHAPGIKKLLSAFLTYQWKVEKGFKKAILIKKSRIKLLFPKLPQQRNNTNCGVYIISFFRCFVGDPYCAYRRIYLTNDLSDWFSEHKIDINHQRVYLKKVASNLRSQWESQPEKQEGSICQDEFFSSDGNLEDDDDIMIVE